MINGLESMSIKVLSELERICGVKLDVLQACLSRQSIMTEKYQKEFLETLSRIQDLAPYASLMNKYTNMISMQSVMRLS